MKKRCTERLLNQKWDISEQNNLTMKKRCKLKRKTTRIAGTERENFKDVKEMESSKNDQKSEKEEKRHI